MVLWKKNRVLLMILSLIIGGLLYGLPTKMKLNAKDTPIGIEGKSALTVAGDKDDSAAKSTYSLRPELLTDSMGGKLSGTVTTAIAVVPNPNDGSDRKEYVGTLAGFREAMFDIYQNGDGGNYGVYIGTNIDVTTLTAEIPQSVPSVANITFSALKGKAANLVFTSTLADEITSNTTAVTGGKMLTFGTNVHMGTGVTFRNVSYSGSNMFMNGNDLHLGGSSYGNGLSVYGGANTADVVGNPTMTIDSTGGGTWYFYGGNATTGSLTGNVNMIINNTSAAINTFSGGAKAGTVNGNINLNIKNTKGLINNINGGGVGTATNTANVDGKVEVTVESDNPTTGLSYQSYIGGVKNGNITGSITNIVGGYGSFYGSIDFIGGSIDGNIGSDSKTLVIKNNVDISKYINSTMNQFVGANNGKGTIRGNVENHLRSGPVTGNTRINGISGLGGFSAPRLNQSSIQGGHQNSNDNIDAYDQLSTDEKIAIVEKVAQFKVYGNVETWLLGGRMGAAGGGSAGFTKGAGFGGLIIGDSTIHVGTANGDGSTGGNGFVSTGNYADLNYSTSIKNRGSSSVWDIVAGGGLDGAFWEMFKVGNNNTIINNAVARWTYSGGGSGVYVGKNTVTLNGGILDTLEGNGYMVQRHYGDTEAIINNGQVDWFATPGGWSNVKRIGNGKMTINDGTINAHIGSTYQEANVYGNSETIIKGGNFSSTPSGSTTKMFSGGPNASGNLHGSSILTIDFREYDGSFGVPNGTFITAGLANGSGGSLGSSAADTATLNIFTKPGVDSLKGATVYGTVGAAGRNKIGSIYMNIDAPDSSIGNLLAWDQTNISGGIINKNVEVNIQRALSIGTVSGGNATDNFTNTIVKNSPDKKVIFNFGVEVGAGGNTNFQTTPINITSGGLKNFTELNVDNGTLINAAGGNFLNGGSATAANHRTTYNEFGNLNIKNGGGIGVSSANGYISVGDVSVTGESKIETMPGTGVINLSSLKFSDETSRFNWVKLAGGAASVMSKGSYWGDNQAYQVLTFNPEINNANVVSPFNFFGIEKATGKTFIGDNDVTKTPNGYGIAIPGSIIDYSVVRGVGEVYHNITDVTTSNTPPVVGVGWATHNSGTQLPKVQKGRLVIPTSKGIKPVITSDPDGIEGMWVKGVKVISTKVGSTPENYPERTDDKVQDWASPDENYSYTVESSFKNDAELTARSKIVPLADVQAMTHYSELDAVTEVDGRPFLTSDLSEADLIELQKPLESNEYRVFEINYSAGYGTNKETKKVNLIVVGKNFKISDDGYYTVHTKQDVTLRQAILADLVDNNKFSEFYSSRSYVDGFGLSAEDPATKIAVLPLNGALHLTSLKDATTFPAIDNQPYGISYEQDGITKTLSRDVKIVVTGNTSVVTVEFHNEEDKLMPGHSIVIDKKDNEELIIGGSIDLKDSQYGVLQKIVDLELAGYEIVTTPPNSEVVALNAEKITVVYKLTGLVYLSSAPESINFGTVIFDATVKQVDDASRDKDLVVNDTRVTKSKWVLGAKVKTQLTNEGDSSVTLVDALRYVYGSNTLILNDGLQRIYQEGDSVQPDLKITNISDTWGTTKDSDGIKLVVDPSLSKVLKGDYKGIIEWQFMEATP